MKQSITITRRDNGGLEDLKKAAWYLNALIKHAEECGTPREDANG